jgi:hypothetical protein
VQEVRSEDGAGLPGQERPPGLPGPRGCGVDAGDIPALLAADRELKFIGALARERDKQLDGPTRRQLCGALLEGAPQGPFGGQMP